MSEVLNNQASWIKKFIDFDKENEKFHDNLYLKDFNIVLKMPLNKNPTNEDLSIEKFDLTSNVFILSYE